MTDTDFMATYLGGFMAFFLIFSLLLFILQIAAAFRVAKFGGSGVGYFFFSWLYILLSSKANDWKNFSKLVVVLLGLFTAGIFLPLYILFSLKVDKNKSTSRDRDDD
jgi:hypothetical protein